LEQEEGPLQVRLRAGLAELLVNPQGPDPHTLDERESLIQCGSALFHLKLALRRFGSLGQLELFPDLDQLSLVARVSGEFHDLINTAKSVSIEGLSGKPGGAVGAGEVAVSDEILQRLSVAGANGKAWLVFSQCEASRKRLCEIEASCELHPGSAKEETSRTVPAGASSMGAIRSAWVHFRTSPMASRLLGPSAPPKGQAPMSVERPENMAALAVLKTKTDDRYGWLAAGEVLAQVQLEVAKLNVSSHIFGQAFRARQTRQELRSIIGRKGFVQAIVGFGSQVALRIPSLETSSMPHQALSVATPPVRVTMS
jgi:hypothetical protein